MWFSMINADNYTYQLNHRAKFSQLFGTDWRRVCDYFDVNKATAYRWIANGEPMNKTALRLLDIAASGRPRNRAHPTTKRSALGSGCRGPLARTPPL